MSENQQYCVECGASTAGRFCAQCGTATAPFTTAAPVDDDPTRRRTLPPNDDEATRAVGGAESYSFYRTQHDSAPPALAPVHEQPSHNRGRIVAGVVAVGVMLAAVGVGTMLGRSGGKNHDAPKPVAVSASSSATSTAPSQAAPSQPSQAQGPSSAAAPTQTSSGAPPAQTGGGQAPQQVAPTFFDPRSLNGFVESISHDGTEYAMTRQGTSVGIYVVDSGAARQEATFQLAGEPDMRPVAQTHLELISLPFCSKPTVVFNARAEKGSAAFGWDGSGYQAYKAPSGEWNMSPTGGDGASSRTYGVTLDGNTIVYRDTKDTPLEKRTRFSSCTGTSGSVDELHADGH